MLRLFDFECQNPDCSHTFEELVKYEEQGSVLCPLCNHSTKRLIGAANIDPKLGIDPNYPTMYDKWARTRRQRKQIESKRDSHD